jgi:soluble lytic murein transglycosylase-like protein
MRRTTALCPLALSAMAAPLAAAEQQAAEQKPAGQQAAGQQAPRQQAPRQQAPRQQAADERAAIEVLIVEQAKTRGLPASLVRLVIRRESNFNPRAIYRGNYGLMQIRLGTARALGYRGIAEGLLDPVTNMTYGMSYLAGAYRAARGDEARTLVLYSRGYHDVH